MEKPKLVNAIPYLNAVILSKYVSNKDKNNYYCNIFL